jgi:hypothetical protein
MEKVFILMYDSYDFNEDDCPPTSHQSCLAVRSTVELAKEFAQNHCKNWHSEELEWKSFMDSHEAETFVGKYEIQEMELI